MSGTEHTTPGVGARPALTATTVVLFAGIVASLALFILVFFLYLRAKRYWGAILGRAVPLPPAAAPPRGLDASAVGALPSVVFRAEQGGGGADCAVCLCELAEGETARLLPRCGHAFHLECIDMWFSSHSTCPLCRVAVVAGGGGARRKESSLPEIPASPPLLRAPEEGSSGSSAGIEVEAPPSPLLTAGVLAEEEAAARSPLPQPAALRSLRRFLVGGGDVEQGNARGPKAPTSS